MLTLPSWVGVAGKETFEEMLNKNIVMTGLVKQPVAKRSADPMDHGAHGRRSKWDDDEVWSRESNLGQQLPTVSNC